MKNNSSRAIRGYENCSVKWGHCWEIDWRTCFVWVASKLLRRSQILLASCSISLLYLHCEMERTTCSFRWWNVLVRRMTEWTVIVALVNNVWQGFVILKDETWIPDPHGSLLQHLWLPLFRNVSHIGILVCNQIQSKGQTILARNMLPCKTCITLRISHLL